MRSRHPGAGAALVPGVGLRKAIGPTTWEAAALPSAREAMVRLERDLLRKEEAGLCDA